MPPGEHRPLSAEDDVNQTFHMMPAGNGPVIIFALSALVLGAILAGTGWVAYASRHTALHISASGLTIKGGPYGRTIPLAALDTAHAQAIRFDTNPELAPRGRSNGIGIPGYVSGWYKLANGEKALLFMTRRTSLVHVPTKEGYSVIVSVDSAQAFIDALRQAAAS